MLRIVDFGGHPFTAELAISLAESGTGVHYTYCLSNSSAPRGQMDSLDKAGLDVRGIDLGHPFEKHSPLKRLRDEVSFGMRLLSFADESEVVACQLPVISAWILLLASKLRRRHFVLWLQDFQADLARLTSGRLLARILATMEGSLIRRSGHVVCISEGFERRCRDLGRSGSISILPNWAPIDKLPVVDRVNSWSKSQGLREESFRVIYSGTMGMKHRADDLLELARCLDQAESDFEVVYIAVGAGLEAIRDDLKSLACVRVLPLQPHEFLAEALGSADVLIVSLDDSANEACVPSKVLSYLCAGRPILGMLDASNPSAQLVEDSGAGRVFSDGSSLLDSLQVLRQNVEARRQMGLNGRTYAERNFVSTAIVKRFHDAVQPPPE